MSRPILTRYLNPWKYKREQEEAARVQALRTRDGEDCRRCRRPLRFDLSEGQDLGAKIEWVVPEVAGGMPALDNFCLTHRRCHTEAADYTAEVKERIRRKAEADLLSRSRKRKSKAA